jgi:hypothetical protein
VPMSKRKSPLDFYPGSARIDFSAWSLSSYVQVSSVPTFLH